VRLDHVHLLLELPPNLDLSVFVNNLKTTSSRLLPKEFADKLNRVYRKPVLWARSYASFRAAVLRFRY
jgi:putative transposase